MSILNYFFIGTAFTFIIDLILGMEYVRNHPKMQVVKWGIKERVACIFIWPAGMLIFSISFIKAIFK